MTPARQRRLHVGAELIEANTASFRVWAPASARVEVVTYRPDDGDIQCVGELAREDAVGYWVGELENVEAGTRYRFRLDGGDAFPDPASRFQPDGPHGPSAVIDPARFAWTDQDWSGVALPGQVLYELHVGTFTPEGTFRAATDRLDWLADIGVTVIEMMPIADFPGRFGWGYDGVDLFAPTRLYGHPDDLRAFIDAAHGLGIGVILDVVYNHLGPDGNYLQQYARHYFSKRATEWGNAINFDSECSRPVRDFFVANARYWIEEFHFDGLRLDATQQIFDDSRPHILAEVRAAVTGAARGRRTIVVAEDERQRAWTLDPPDHGGCGLEGVWNDDFHHSARVALTGRAEAYYSGYRGSPQELLSAVKYGFLYQGQYYAWQKNRRGHPALDVARHRFVTFLQNHDQVANSPTGERIHALAGAGRLRALTALLLLAPQTPMLFQGQEFAASAPFLYFADHTPELAKLVLEGRGKFLSQFPGISADPRVHPLDHPADGRTFERSKLEWSDRERRPEIVMLHRDLIAIRRDDSVIRGHATGSLTRLDGALIGGETFVVRFFGASNDDRLLVINLGRAFHANPAAEPLVAAPDGQRWHTMFSSEAVRYGGSSAVPLDGNGEDWLIPAESATLLIPNDDGATTTR
jgi:maltooligosyltrehalose trehalohydrolase